MWFHDSLFLQFCPPRTYDSVVRKEVESVLKLSFPHFYLCFFYVFRNVNYPDMIHGFFFFLDSLPGVLLNRRKEGNPFNYCQNPVVRWHAPLLSGVDSSRIAAHGRSAPTPAAAEPALCQWLHLSVTTFQRRKGQQCTRWHPRGRSAYRFHHSDPSRGTRSIKISLNPVGQIEQIILRSVQLRLKQNIGTVTFKMYIKAKAKRAQTLKLFFVTFLKGRLRKIRAGSLLEASDGQISFALCFSSRTQYKNRYQCGAALFEQP